MTRSIPKLIAANEANINSIGLLCGYGNEEELRKYTSNIKQNSLEAINFLKSLS